ncbi:MAG: PAS domain S-box protein, partial [Steroidobacteraceae bacterium]
MTLDRTDPHVSKAQTEATSTARSNGRASNVGFDVLTTKAAVEFQTLANENDPSIKQNLEALREAAGLDAVFIALFDAQRTSIERVLAVGQLFAPFNPDVLHGERLEQLPYLRDRLEPMRILELRDTGHPRRECQAEGARFAALHVGALLLIGFEVRGRTAGFMAMCSARPRDSWDANLHLTLKLLGVSFASGLERLRYRADLADSEARNELALYGANDGLWELNFETSASYYAPRWRAMLGYDQQPLPEMTSWQQLVHPEDAVRVHELLQLHLNGEDSLFESTHRLKHREGDWIWVVSRGKVHLDEHGKAKRMVGVDLDITERKLFEEALFREKESAQITLQSIGDGVITTDSQCRIEYLNPVAEQLTGWRLEHAQGHLVHEIFRSFHEETCEPLENPLAVAIRRARAIKSIRPTLLIRRDGNELYIESCASPIRDNAGEISGGVLVFHDVSESRELNRKLSYHASHDMLTGLVNRREFEARLERALKSARARETAYALCHIDLDQ